MLSQEIIINNLHNSRRLLIQTPLFHSQAPSPNDHLTPTPSHKTNSFDANVVMVLSVLICAVICSLFINSLIKCVLKCSSIMNREPNHYLTRVNLQIKLSNGVGKRALKTFPVVKFSSDQDKIVHGLGSDCVICLSEFKEGEKVRILPKCNHGFHVKCIDKWLSSRASCPTCRQSLVDTCQKIIGSCQVDDDLQATISSPSSPLSSPSSSTSSSPSSSPSSSVGVTGEMVAISMVPLERENIVRNYRGNNAEQS